MANESVNLINDAGGQNTGDGPQTGIKKLQQMCCNNKSSKRAGAGVAVCIAVAAVIIIIIIVTLSVLLTMPSGNSSTNATSLNDTNMTTIPSTDAAPTLTSQRSHTPVLTSTAPTATSQFSKIPVVTGTTPGLTSKISQTTISTSTETTLPSELSETTISTSTLPPYTSQLSRTTISSSTPPTYTSELSQTTISKSTPPTFTSELSETTISTDTAPTHTSQLSQTSVSTVLTPMLPATIPSVTFLPHTTQSRTTIPLPTVPRTSSFFSTLLGETTQSRTTIGLPTVPRITTTGPTAIPITQSPCNVLTVDENSRIEVLEPIPTMSAVTACIWAQTDEVSGGTPFSYNTAGADNEFFLSFPENFRVGIRGATTGATGVSVNDGAWHHVCVTWNSVGGIFNIYDNGVLAFGGSSFRTGLMIRSGGVLILGQEQDTLGGGFDPGQAFKGDLANFNMWNRELDGVDILHSTNDCSCDIEGNVFSWKSDSIDIAGTALVSAEDFCPKPSLTNVALDKTATQSSDWSVSFPASNAVDGNTNTHWGSGSCTSTQRDVNAWWKVDLGENYLVYEVILTNRQDPCCKTRILNSEVRIGLSDVISENIRCGELVALEQTSQSDVVFECDSPIVGRYASLQLVDRTDLLNFCEMRVMALENIGRNGIASQISTGYRGLASYAIDGNDNSIYYRGSCTHTSAHLNPWWKVDLGETYDIFKVVITNRQDCCPHRIDGAVVLIGEFPDISQNSQCDDQVDLNANTYQRRIPFDCRLRGRYAGVQLKHHTNFLTLCEVEVYGS